MSSFQASGGTLRKCLRKRPSVSAKSAKVSGTVISPLLPSSSRYPMRYSGQSASIAGLPSIEAAAAKATPASGS